MNEIAHVSDPSRQLLHWWYQHQTQVLQDEADAIRNGVLQELFGLRRRLELSCPGATNRTTHPCETCLGDLDRIYAALESLSDRLSSPYRQSLPLAIQHALQPWQAAVPLTTELPTTWETEPEEQVAVILAILNHLLQSLPPQPVHYRVSLRPSGLLDKRELTLQAAYESDLPDPVLPAMEAAGETLTRLLQVFHSISNGEWGCDQHSREILWRLRW